MSERIPRLLRAHTTRARLAVVVLACGLVAATGVVWFSPSSADDDATAPSAEEQRLAAENAQLRGKLTAREQELAALRASEAKAAAERARGAARGQDRAAAEKAAAAAQERQREAAAARRGQQKAAADHATAARLTRLITAKAAAEQDAAAAKAEAERAAGAASGRAKAALEKRLAAARGWAEGAQARADAADAAAARARDALAASEARTPPAATPPTKPTAPSKSALLSPALRYYGLYTAQSPFNWAEWDDVTSKVGVAPTIAGYFQGWDGGFRPDAVERAWAKGALPLLTWESQPLTASNNEAIDPDYSLPQILSGRYDDYLRRYAKAVVALGLPLAIRLDHEMNGNWYPWSERDYAGNPLNGNGPGDYVRMWRHVHDIFQEEGADRYVIWVWAPNIVNRLAPYAQDPSYLRSLYPGDDYVDWVGLSGYYRPPYASDQTPTFDYTYGPSLTQLRSITSKPILLAEVGASEIGGEKPAWITGFFDALARRENADVVGFAWFSETVTTVTGGELVTNDWRVTSRASSLAAFVAGIHDPAAGFVAATTASASTHEP